MTRSVTRAALAALSLAAIGGPAAAQDWKPGGPINIIVPWGAGGSTDQVTRVTAPILAEALGVSVVVVNQPGASGAIGTQAVLDAPTDGLTWTANAIANNATYQVSGLLEDTDIDDWHIYLSVANAPLISVPADSEFQDFGQLLEAFRERGDEITVATAGVTSSGGTAIATLAQPATSSTGWSPTTAAARRRSPPPPARRWSRPSSRSSRPSSSAAAGCGRSR